MATVEKFTTDGLRSAPHKPRFHPNGFVQLDLVDPSGGRGHSGGSTRLHVWPWPYLHDPEAPASPIHDHIFDMHSEVIVGGIIQTEFAVTLMHGGEPTFEIWIPHYDRKSSSRLEKTGVQVDLWPDTTVEYRAGSGYSQPAFSFHTSNWSEISATIMTKRYVHEDNDCRVMVPVGQDPNRENEDRMRIPEDTLWEVIDQALRELR